MFRKLLNKVANYFGYYTNESNDEIRNLYLEQTMQVHGLLNSIGYLQRESQEQNLLLTALISSQGREEEILTKAFLSDILDRRLETLFGQEPNGDVKLVIQLKQENCEDCGNCGGDFNDDEILEE